MLRASLCALVVLAAGLGGCHKNADPPPVHPQEGEAPPLPPSSGTPVGYLIDNAPTLKLRDDQLVKLKDIDRSLSAKDDELDTQIRMIEKPAEDPEVPKGAPPPRHNNAPGAQIKTTPEAAKLHAARSENDFQAIQQAFALLDEDQKVAARKLLEERGVLIPRGKPAPRAGDGAP